MDYFLNLKKFKKLLSLNNADLGRMVGKSGDTFRKALNRKSLSLLELSLIFQELLTDKYPKKPELKTELIEIYNDVITEFSDKTDTSPNSVIPIRLKNQDNKLIGRKFDFSKNKIEDEWESLSVNESSEVFVTKSGNRLEELPNGKFRLYSKLVPVKAQASYISQHQDADYVDDLSEITWVVDKVPKGTYRTFEVMNDSMNDGTINSIPNGSFVLGRLVDRDKWMSKLHNHTWSNWVIVTKDNILVKEIVSHDVENGIITCHSLNQSPEYANDFPIHLNDVAQLFNVVKRQID